ncbi:MAG: hypothetical protein ACOZHQ_05990 [Thermodesulfobacteriota bacterium]
MSQCSFLYQNLIADPGQVGLSSARPGMVGAPVPRALGTATALSGGEHAGAQDQIFVVEIDSVAAGQGVGQASFRWRRGDAAGWEAAGVATSSAFVDLADGVRIKWQSGAGPDFLLGDAWTILATRNQGPAMLTDADRDTEWVSQGCAAESLALDAGQAVSDPVLVLMDHNLGDDAMLSLEPGLVFHPAPEGGELAGERAWEMAAVAGGFPQDQGRLQLRWTPESAWSALPLTTNKFTNHNANPFDLTNMTKYGDAAASLSVVDDSAALQAAGLKWLCSSGRAYRLDNSGGASRAYARFGGLVGDTNPHSVSVWMRAAAGQGNLQAATSGASVWLNPPVADPDYQRYKKENWTPGVSTDYVQVVAEPGGVVYFILNQLEEGPAATHEVVTAGEANGATRSAYQPLVSQNGQRRCLLYFYAEPGHGHLASFDGVNVARMTLDWAAGQPHDLTLTWGGGGLNLSLEGGASATAPYAGAFPLGGELVLLMGGPAGHRLDLASLKLYDAAAPPAPAQPAPTRPHLVHRCQGQARHWRLIIRDPMNPAGCLRASLVHLGPAFTPSRTFLSAYQRSLVAGRSTTATDAGKLTGSTRGLAEAWQIGFRGLSAEDIARFEAMFAAIHDPGQGRLNPIIFIPFDDDPGRCLYCLPGPRLTPQPRHAQSYELALGLEEVIKSHV